MLVGLFFCKLQGSGIKRFIASLLIFCNFSQMATAGFLPLQVNQNNNQILSPYTSQKKLAPFNTDAVPIPETLTLTTEQFGLAGPISGALNCSDLTGTFISGQFLKAITDSWRIGIIGEYGAGQYRLNGTIGFFLAAKSLLKITAEQFSQRLP